MTRVLFLSALLVVAGCRTTRTAQTGSAELPKPKNIILMIGDGMGITQITAGMYSNKNYLHLERCPVVGLIKTLFFG